MAAEPLLKAEKISKAFPGVQALDQVNFDLEKGEVHALVGANGAGKSTLIKILAGVYAKDSGRIYLDGQEVDHYNPRQARIMGISYIPQEPVLVPQMSVTHNLLLGKEPTFKRLPLLIDNRALQRQARAILSELEIDCPQHVPISRLSPATRQMIAIATALSQKSRILIMDEPTSALAEGQIFKVFQLVRQLKARGLAIIYISHQLGEIFEIADRVTVLRNGSSCGTFPLNEIDEASLVRLIVGRDFTSYASGSTATSFGAEALAVKGLTRRGAYEDINMVVHEGEIVGIFGQVGAGRTELLRGIFGVDPVDAGEIRVAGTPVHIDSPITAIHHGLGFLTEDRKGQGLVPCMGVADNIVLASLDFISRRGLIDLERRNAIAGRFVQELNIKTPDLNRWVKFLSGGNQQKVILARWLSRSCRILLLDEPMKGIDVGAKAELRRLMRDLAGKGVALVVVFSDPAEVLDICDRILVMREGRITGDFLQGEVTKEQLIACSI